MSGIIDTQLCKLRDTSGSIVPFFSFNNLFVYIVLFVSLSLSFFLPLLHYNAVSLCRGFVTTELVSLKEEESARILGVLDVDG